MKNCGIKKNKSKIYSIEKVSQRRQARKGWRWQMERKIGSWKERIGDIEKQVDSKRERLGDVKREGIVIESYT